MAGTITATFRPLNTSTTFKIGDTVKISPESEFYGRGGNPNNPQELAGIVTSINGTQNGGTMRRPLPISVRWPNGHNIYGDEDLILVRAEPIVLTATLENI